MPVEFALRPRIRLREAPAPARRARARLPKFALPALAYWLAIGGLVYEFVRHHEPSALAPPSEAALALPDQSPPVVRPWWRPLPTQPERTEPVAAPTAPNEPAVAEPDNTASSEPPLAELAAPAETAPELASELSRAPDAPRDPMAEQSANARAPRRPRGHGAAPPPPEPPPTPELSAVREFAQNNVGVPAPPLSFAPLDEPVPAHAFTPPPAPTPPPSEGSRPSASSGLPSCEAALASASQDIDFSGGNRTADLPTQAIAAVLENGAWLTGCNVPERTTVDVCVAIKGGHVVGASVTSRPADSSLNNCVKRRASSLQFPYSPHLDVARTRF